jgi:hypothetical protein
MIGTFYIGVDIVDEEAGIVMSSKLSAWAVSVKVSI